MSNKKSLRWTLEELQNNPHIQIIDSGGYDGKKVDKYKIDEAGQTQPPKSSKYHNKKCEYKGIKFDSHKERDYYIDLLHLQSAGEVTCIELQVCFPYRVKYFISDHGREFEKDYKYIADFRVHYKDGRKEVIDIKGNYQAGQTRTFRTKKMIVEKLYNIEILIR